MAWYTDVTINLDVGVDKALELSSELEEHIEQELGIPIDSSGTGFGARNLRFESIDKKEAKEIEEAAKSFLSEALDEEDFQITSFLYTQCSTMETENERAKAICIVMEDEWRPYWGTMELPEGKTPEEAIEELHRTTWKPPLDEESLQSWIDRTGYFYMEPYAAKKLAEVELPSDATLDEEMLLVDLVMMSVCRAFEIKEEE